MVSWEVGVLGSLVSTVTPLAMGPAKLVVSTWALILPVSPGLISLSKSATVQPQPGLAAMICRSAVPVFLMTNDQSSFSPLGTTPKSLTGSTMVSRGAFSASFGSATAAGSAVAAGAFAAPSVSFFFVLAPSAANDAPQAIEVEPTASARAIMNRPFDDMTIPPVKTNLIL